MMRAVNGRCSQTCSPATLVEIALNGPRYFASPFNFISNVSRWLIGCGEKKFNCRVWTLGKLKIERLSSFPWWSYSFSFYWTDKHYSFYRFGWKLDDVQQGRSCFMYRITPWRSV